MKFTTVHRPDYIFSGAVSFIFDFVHNCSVVQNNHFHRALGKIVYLQSLLDRHTNYQNIPLLIPPTSENQNDRPLTSLNHDLLTFNTIDDQTCCRL